MSLHRDRTRAGRWEWRAFGETFGAAEDRFAALAAECVKESDELYLVSPARDATVKVRDRLMDVKRLQRVGPAGLQQWAPAMKAEFPMPATQVREVAAALRIPVPALARTAYTLPQLVEEHALYALAGIDPYAAILAGLGIAVPELGEARRPPAATSAKATLEMTGTPHARGMTHWLAGYRSRSPG